MHLSSIAAATMLTGGSVLLFAGGCGATYRSAYDGDARFEHCYRLDEERSVSIQDKRACWQQWTREYTYGQSRDRIEYAVARGRALNGAGALGSQRSPTPERSATAGPIPTSVFVPPPQVIPVDAGAPTTEPLSLAAATHNGRPRELATAPGASCGMDCGRNWVDCGGGCHGAPCQALCDERYRGCMRRCF